MRQERPPDEHFIVEFSEQCEADLDTCYLRLSRNSPEVAARWQKEILAACFSLSQFPRRCPLAPGSQSFGREVRLLLYRNRRTVYRILYTIFDATEDASGQVRILRVRQGARQEADAEDKS